VKDFVFWYKSAADVVKGQRQLSQTYRASADIKAKCCII